jgi:hypothetical protein
LLRQAAASLDLSRHCIRKDTDLGEVGLNVYVVLLYGTRAVRTAEVAENLSLLDQG